MKMAACRKYDAIFSKKKKELKYDHCNLDSKTVVLDENAKIF